MIPNNEQSLRELFDTFILECEYSSRLSIATIRSYKEVFKLFELLMPEVTSIQVLSSTILTEFFKRLQERYRIVGKGTIRKGVKSSTVRTYRSKLHAFLHWLHQKSILSDNPLTNIKPPVSVYEDIKALSEEEIKKLYAAIVLHSPNPFILHRDTLMISLFFYTGIRRGEFLALEVRDIDMQEQLIAIRSNTSKSKRMRYIPIHPTLAFHLKQYLKARNERHYKSQFLITSSTRDDGLTPHGLKHWTNTLEVKSGIKFHLHQFRHAFACILAANNVNPIKIQKLLGHSSIEMTMTYLRSISTQDLADDIQKISL